MIINGKYWFFPSKVLQVTTCVFCTPSTPWSQPQNHNTTHLRNQGQSEPKSFYSPHQQLQESSPSWGSSRHSRSLQAHRYQHSALLSDKVKGIRTRQIIKFHKEQRHKQRGESSSCSIPSNETPALQRMYLQSS